MSFNYNRVIISGNLTRDPQVKFLANEKAVANFGLAINRRFKGADGQQREDVVFVDVEAWGRTAELVGQYLTKGRGAMIEGRLKLDQWEDKEGQKRQKLAVVADAVHFTDAPERQPDAGKDAAATAKRIAEVHAPSTPIDDEPPF